MQVHRSACILEHSGLICIHSGTFCMHSQTFCMHSGTFWNFLQAFWNILHAFWNILECSECILNAFLNILYAFWNILHAFWIILHAFWNILDTAASDSRRLRVLPCCKSAGKILAGPGRQKQLKLCTVQQIKYNLVIKIFCLVSVQLITFPALLPQRNEDVARLAQQWEVFEASTSMILKSCKRKEFVN